MATAIVREIDGQVMLQLAAETVAELALTADAAVEVTVDKSAVIVQPEGPYRRRKYKLSELLADWDQIPKDPAEEHLWLNSPPVGRELI